MTELSSRDGFSDKCLSGKIIKLHERNGTDVLDTSTRNFPKFTNHFKDILKTVDQGSKDVWKLGRPTDYGAS